MALTNPTVPRPFMAPPIQALVNALKASLLLGAAKALVDRDCSYDGANIIIPCSDHAEAIRLVANLRAAIETVEAQP